MLPFSLQPGTSSESVARADARYHFVLEMDGYVYNMVTDHIIVWAFCDLRPLYLRPYFSYRRRSPLLM